MAKPDNRADNAQKLKQMAQNTMDNLKESQEYLDEHAEEISTKERSDIESKNERRKESIEGFESEAQDEQNFQQQQQ